VTETSGIGAPLTFNWWGVNFAIVPGAIHFLFCLRSPGKKTGSLRGLAYFWWLVCAGSEGDIWGKLYPFVPGVSSKAGGIFGIFAAVSEQNCLNRVLHGQTGGEHAAKGESGDFGANSPLSHRAAPL